MLYRLAPYGRRTLALAIAYFKYQRVYTRYRFYIAGKFCANSIAVHFLISTNGRNKYRWLFKNENELAHSGKFYLFLRLSPLPGGDGRHSQSPISSAILCGLKVQSRSSTLIFPRTRQPQLRHLRDNVSGVDIRKNCNIYFKQS